MWEAFWRLCLLKLGSSLPSREKDERTSPFCKLFTPFMDHSSLQLQHPLGSRADFYPDTCGQTVWPAATQVHLSLRPTLCLPVCCPGSVYPSFLLSFTTCCSYCSLPVFFWLPLQPPSLLLSPISSVSASLAGVSCIP